MLEMTLSRAIAILIHNEKMTDRGFGSEAKRAETQLVNNWLDDLGSQCRDHVARSPRGRPEMVTDYDVEEGVRRVYECHLSRKILVHYATVWCKGSPTERSFDPPVEATLKTTEDYDIINWMDKDHLDPHWAITVTAHHRQLLTGEEIYDVYGMGWDRESGYDAVPCAEWRFVP